MSTPKWLKDYYGEQFDSFHPELIVDGRKFAIVRIYQPQASRQMYHSIGYVLLRKGGRHEGVSHQSLHEGVPNQADMDRMKAVLQKADA